MTPWRTYAQLTKKIEDAFVPKIMRVIKNFRASFISDLKEHGQHTAISNLQQNHTAEGLQPLIESIYKVAGAMGAKMTASELKALAKQKSGGFGTNATWVVQVLQFLRLHMLNTLSGITDTMRDDILKTLQKGVDQGWSIDRIVQELEREDLAEARARLITRTEINKASNQGHAIAAQSTPYEVDKGWSAARDHRTRESHVLMNGQWIDEFGTFRVPIFKGDILEGYEEMTGPGDPSGSAANVCNCRCRKLYKPKRDAQGKLIMRNPNQATVIPLSTASTQISPAQIAAILKENVYIGIQK